MVINPDSRIDLHIHTSGSDGTWSLTQLLVKLEQTGIEIFSITDHDSIASVKELLARPLEEERHFIIGAEISCTYQNREYHLLAYAFNPQEQELLELLAYNQEQREKYNRTIVKFVQGFTPSVSLKDYLSYQNPIEKGGWRSLNYLVERGVICTIGDFFNLAGECEEKMVFLPPQQVIKVIKGAGGFPFLAHPSAYQGGKLLPEKDLKEWEGMGIAGIECFSPYLARIKDADYYLDFCRRNKLMISGGSDCHGEFSPRELGNPPIKLKQLKLDFIK